MQDKFIVPQFIDAENKIFGPITVRQFLLMVGGAIFIFLSFKLSDFALFLFEAIVTVIFVFLFGFYKVNGAPFHIYALNLTETLKQPAVRIWRKEYIKVETFADRDKKINKKDQYIVPEKPFAGAKKLSELSLIIDTGGVYKGEKDANDINNIAFKK